MILAGDVGGTKVVLALFEQVDDGFALVHEAVFRSSDHENFESSLDTFLAECRPGPLNGGCFGVPGPVINGKSRATNLPWVLDEVDLAGHLDVPRVHLINDVEAAAFGMLFLPPAEFERLNPNAPPPAQGNIAIIAPGTGLGEAMLYWDGEHHHPIASEGGHADFGPRTDQQIELLRYLRSRFGGHVSYERLCAGAGLANIYSFLRERGDAPEPAWLSEQLAAGDPNAVITEAGLAGKDQLCAEVLDLFCTILGAEAGNLALKFLAVGGVVLGGGILPKMLPALRNKNFIEGFVDKGRFADLLRSLDVRVSLNPRAPVIGAAHFFSVFRTT